MFACTVVAELHAKDEQLFRAVRERYGSSVRREACLTFVKCCPHCIQARPRQPKAAGHKPIHTQGFASRGQVDLIDFQSFPDRDFKWLLVYVDHGIKLCMLIPLTSKRADAVAVALLRIFTTIGAPAILQSDNGREFTQIAGSGKLCRLEDEELDSVISALSELWPEVKLVKGRARHSESNGGVERLNQTVQRRMAGWMSSSGTRSWSVGCMLVQWAINTSYHAAIKTTPYELTFGLSPVPNANTAMLGLETVLESWQGLPSVGIRAIAASVSPAGGQGLLSCACKGSCQGGRCACFKAGRKCNSRCHKSSRACCNCD